MNNTWKGTKSYASKGYSYIGQFPEKFKSTGFGGKVAHTGSVAMDKSKSIAKGSYNMAG